MKIGMLNTVNMKQLHIDILSISELRSSGNSHFLSKDQLFTTQDIENKEAAMLPIVRKGIARTKYEYNAIVIE